MKRRFLFSLLSLLSLSLAAEVSPKEVEEALLSLREKRRMQLKQNERGQGVLTLSGSLSFTHSGKVHEVNGEDHASAHEKGEGSDKQKITASLLLNYEEEKSWAKLEFSAKNNFGLQKVKTLTEKPAGDSAIEIRQALFGMKCREEEGLTLSWEIGRQPAYLVFPSPLQFGSSLDAIVLRAKKQWEAGTLSLTVAPRSLNSPFNHFGFIAQIGMDKIAGSGFSLSYSYNHLDGGDYKKVKGEIVEENRFEANRHLYLYQNSEIQLHYTFAKPWLSNQTRLFASFIYNHAAEKEMSEIHQGEEMSRHPSAWCMGLALGKTPTHTGEWQAKLQVEHVGENAISEYDHVGGANIGISSLPLSPKKPNYCGIRLKTTYAWTDNLFLNGSLLLAREIEERIRGSVRYRAWELGVSYKF